MRVAIVETTLTQGVQARVTECDVSNYAAIARLPGRPLRVDYRAGMRLWGKLVLGSR